MLLLQDRCWCQEAQDVPVADHCRLSPVPLAFPAPWQLMGSASTGTGDGCEHCRTRWCLILIGRSIRLCWQGHWKGCRLVASSLFSKSGTKLGVLCCLLDLQQSLEIAKPFSSWYLDSKGFSHCFF